MILDIFRVKSAKKIDNITMQFVNTPNKSMRFSRLTKIADKKLGL